VARLTVEQVKKAKGKFKFREREVEIPDLGGTILLRGLGVGAASALHEELIDPDTGNTRAGLDMLTLASKLLAAVCADPELSEDAARDLIDAMPVVELAPILDDMRFLAGMGEETSKEILAAGSDFRQAED